MAQPAGGRAAGVRALQPHPALARLGYIQAARRIDPNVQAPSPEDMLPELLAQAEERRLIGDQAGSAGFLQAAARQVPAAPAYAPALAAAYADLGDIARAIPHFEMAVTAQRHGRPWLRLMQRLEMSRAPGAFLAASTDLLLRLHLRP